VRIVAIAWLLVVVVTGQAFADQPYDTCLASGDEAQCGDQWIAREQSSLDEAWRLLTEVADGDVATAIKAEQEAWVAFSRLACLFKKDPGFGGAGGPRGYHGCRAKLIADRTEALRDYISYIDN
jgi:uncharacterized protein YecT (DUF1311 family)